MDGAMPGQPFSFAVDARGTGGLGDVIIDIVHDKQSVPYRIEDTGTMQYRVSFLPRDAGKYRVYVYFNGSDVRGSPFSLRVGTQRGSRRSKESTSSLERTKMSSLERRMNGTRVSNEQRSSPVQKSYKSPSPTQGFRDSHVKIEARTQSPVHQASAAYKNSNFTKESNSSSVYQSSSLNRTSPSNTLRNLHSPSMIKESKDVYSTSSISRSRSPNVNYQSPSFGKESSFGSLNRARSPNPGSPNANIRNLNSPSVIKESKEIYQSNSLNRSRSPNSPMAFRNSPQDTANRSFSPRIDRDRRGSTDNSVVDTTSNVRGVWAFRYPLKEFLITHENSVFAG